MSWNLAFLRRLNRLAESCLHSLGSPEWVQPAPIERPIRKVLLVKFVGLGDGVLVRSLAEHLRRQRPDMRIGVLAGSATREVMSCASDFATHSYDPAGSDGGLLGAVNKLREIRRERYEALVDFEQHWLLASVFLAMTGIPYRIGLAAAGSARSRFQTHTVPLSGQDSMWKAYVHLVRLVEPCIPQDATTVPLPRSAQAVAEMDHWWRLHFMQNDGPVVAMHLGSGSRSQARRWPVARFVALAERIWEREKRMVAVLTGIPAERPLVREFQTCFSGPSVDATCLGSIARTAELLRRCDLLVSSDTGIMHLGAAMGTPTVGVFGPNTPARYGPVGPRATAVYTTRVPCSPCVHVHLGVVPECFNEERGRCMLDVDVESVFRAAQRVRRGARVSGMCEEQGQYKRDEAMDATEDRAGDRFPTALGIPDPAD